MTTFEKVSYLCVVQKAKIFGGMGWYNTCPYRYLPELLEAFQKAVILRNVYVYIINCRYFRTIQTVPR